MTTFEKNLTHRMRGGWVWVFGLAGMLIFGLVAMDAMARPPQGEASDHPPSSRGQAGDPVRGHDQARGHRGAGQLSDAEVELVMSTLAKVNPETHAKLTRLREKRPQVFHGIVRRYYPAIRAITTPIGEGGFREQFGHPRPPRDREGEGSIRSQREDRRDKRPSRDAGASGGLTDPLEGGPRRGRPARITAEDLTEAREAAILEVVGQMHPRLARHLEKTKSENPQRYEKALLRIAGHPRVQHMLQTRNKYPEAYKAMVKTARLDVEIEKLAGKLHSARALGESEKAAELKGKLRELLSQKFDASLRLRQARLERMGEQLEKLRAQLKDAVEHREQWIDREMGRLMHDGPDRDRGEREGHGHGRGHGERHGPAHDRPEHGGAPHDGPPPGL